MDLTSIFGALGQNAGNPVAAPAGAPMNLSGAVSPTPGMPANAGQPNYQALIQAAQKLIAPQQQQAGMQPMQMSQPLGMLNRLR